MRDEAARDRITLSVPLGGGDNNAGVEAGIMALVAMGAISASASRPRGLRAGSRGDAPGSHV